MSKKKVQQKKKQQKRSNRSLYIGICAAVFVVVFILISYAWLSQSNQQNSSQQNNTSNYRSLWKIDSSGKLNFTSRGPIQADSDAMVATGTNYTLENISYNSFGSEVYALLRIPTNVTKPPVVIVDPALTITKEMDAPTAEALCNMGYATLTLDQRGFGQTGGDYTNNYNVGFSEFMGNGTPVQYEQIYDILRGLDYVKTRPDLDGNDTAVMGESIGSVWAIDAAGIEPQLKGVITISGFDIGFNGSDNPQENQFIYSIMPSKYLPDLPPRELAMFQFDNDSIVPLNMSKQLYNEALEPKALYVYNGSVHGLWNDAFTQNMTIELKNILGR